ncbi:MAG: hypothetical protein EOL97_13910, partial [Spirochaetia bacterium]|nr:hypothetical protein [Spirochaetia bacterium]
NCYYIDLKDDSTEAIFQLCSEMSSIYKYRGGVGIDISKLRPRGASVHNNAKTSSGSVSFMPLFSKVTSTIAQEGRRGALMISISVDHPDVLEFISAKEDLTKITAANISVKITKEFTEALASNQEYFPLKWCKDTLTKEDLEVFDRKSKNIDYTYKYPLYMININGKDVYVKIARTQDLFHRLVEANHKSAEPGILLWDNIIDYSLSSYYPQYRELGTNPCQPEWATVLTPTGIKTFKNINVGDFIWSSEGWTTIVKKECSGIKDVYNYRTTAGTFNGTDTHKIISRGTKIEVKDAETIDVLAGFQSPPFEPNPMDIMDGLVIGDGSVHTASNSLVYLCIGAQDQDYFSSNIQSLIKKKRSGIKKYAFEIQTTIVPSELPKTYERKIPSRFIEGNPQKVRGFLKGLYSANGSVVNKRVTLKTASPYIRDEVQLMLSSVGIRSYYTTNKSKDTEFPNGIYTCKESYDINISTDREIFYHTIGFIQKYKMDALKLSIEKIYPLDKTHPIVDIEWNSKEPVYNITVDNESHTYWTGGLNVANCGEIPLGDKDACRLFAINLSTVDSGDMNEVYSRAYEQVILADYLVDLEETKIDQILTKINNPKSVEYQLWSTIKNTAKKGRRIGCGLTGLFDYLVKSKYNIKDNPRYALDIAEMLMRTKMKAELDATIDLAIMKGSFVGYTNKESSKLIDFIKEEFPLQYKKMHKYGRRNVSLSTVAPTGSISILAGCASGIEPLFAPYYKRKRKVSNVGPKTAVRDVDGENFEVYTVFHRKLYEWAELNNIKGTPEEIYRESPYYKLCADDLDYKFRIDLQSIVQKYTTHSISSTINLPEHTSVEEIENIYKYAMEVHLKGCTIYRSFSRSGILIKDTPNEVSFDQYDAPSRPKSLQAESFISKSKGITYAVIVGLLDGKPYEIFAAISPPGFKSQKGEIIKVKKGVYRWVGEDGDVLENLNSLSESSIEKITTLYISMLLRTGAKLPFVIKVAKKADGSITSFTSAVCRILGKYIPKGEEKDLCPECGEKLIHEGGCTKCTQCSYSLCLFTYEIKN